MLVRSCKGILQRHALSYQDLDGTVQILRGRVGQANALALFVEARLASERVTGHGYMIQAHTFAVQQLIELQSIGFDLPSSAPAVQSM